MIVSNLAPRRASCLQEPMPRSAIPHVRLKQDATYQIDATESKAERVAANGAPHRARRLSREHRFSPSTRWGCSRTGPGRDRLLSILTTERSTRPGRPEGLHYDPASNCERIESGAGGRERGAPSGAEASAVSSAFRRAPDGAVRGQDPNAIACFRFPTVLQV